MDSNRDRLINRVVEMATLDRVHDRNEPRIIMLKGPARIGKSALALYLYGKCTEPALAAMIDFRRFRSQLLEPEEVILELQELIGGDFARRMEEALHGGVERLLSASSSGVRLDDVRAEHIDISDVRLIQNFHFGPQLGASAGQLNLRKLHRALRDTLRDLTVEQRIILIFDHVDHATEGVLSWLLDRLLRLGLQDAAQFPQLRIVIVGCDVEIQDTPDEWPGILHIESIGRLSDEVICEFWEKNGFDHAECASVAEETQGIPELLLLKARERKQAPFQQNTS